MRKIGGPIKLDTFLGAVRGTPQLAEFEGAIRSLNLVVGICLYATCIPFLKSKSP